jgi:hypothetical protein
MADDAPPTQITFFVGTALGRPATVSPGSASEPGPTWVRPPSKPSSVTRSSARDGEGRHIDYGRSHRTAPPALKRALIARGFEIYFHEGRRIRFRRRERGPSG